MDWAIEYRIGTWYRAALFASEEMARIALTALEKANPSVAWRIVSA